MIDIKNLKFIYEGSSKAAINNINLTINKGDFVGITGPSGAGKTSFLNALNGIIPHHFKGDYYGKVIVKGMDVFESQVTEIAKIAGTVFQDIDSQMVSGYVEDEILYGLENFHVPKDEIEHRITKALSDVGILHLRDREINSLSGGQKQKTAIAAILALKPEVLFLDEPTGELDPSSSRQIFSLLKELNENYGITIIVAEQKIMLLSEFVKTLGIMDKGSFVLYGDTRDVLKNSDVLEEVGVKCPRVVTLMNMLRQEGFVGDEIAINAKEAEEIIRRVIHDRV